MRLTFPAISATGPTQILYQGALACLPVAVDFLAQKLFEKTRWAQRASEIGAILGAVTGLTLCENVRANTGGFFLWAIYELYKYGRPAAAKPQAAEEKPYFWDIHKISHVATSLMTHIEAKGSQVEGIYREPGIDTLVKEDLLFLDKLLSTTPSLGRALDERLKEIKDYKDLHITASIFKGLFQRLKVRLLKPISQEFLEAAKAEEKSKLAAFEAAISKLPSGEQELARLTIRHLGRISRNSDVNRMKSENLATIFAPLLFEITEESPEKAAKEIKDLKAALAYYIKKYPEQ